MRKKKKGHQFQYGTRGIENGKIIGGGDPQFFASRKIFSKQGKVKIQGIFLDGTLEESVPSEFTQRISMARLQFRWHACCFPPLHQFWRQWCTMDNAAQQMIHVTHKKPLGAFIYQEPDYLRLLLQGCKVTMVWLLY